jgi:DHA2 family multidrug resistance protein
MQVNHQELGDRLTATSQAVQNQMPTLLSGDPTVVSIVNGLVTQQAAMMSYLDDFWLMTLLSLLAVPLILLLRGPKKPDPAAKPKTQEEIALERAHAMAE